MSQRRLLLVIIILYLCLLRVQNYKLKPWYKRNVIEIVCDKNESLDFDSANPREDTKHSLNKTMFPTELTFSYCSPPKKPYLKILRDININASKVSVMWLVKMADTYLLKEIFFEGMPLRNLTINDYYVLINSTGTLDLTKSFKYLIDCYSDRSNPISRQPIFPNRIVKPSFVVFDGCNPPNESYSEIFEKLNIMPSSIQELKLKFPPNPSELQPDNFKGLSVPKLSLIFNGIYELDPKAFEEIHADEVFIELAVLKTLKKFRAEKITMQDGKIFGEWGDCSTLTSLKVTRVVVPETAGGWLNNCHNLTDLTLMSISKEDVEKTLLGVRALDTLFVTSCKHNSLTKPFAKDAVNLRKLKFQEFILSYISVDAFSALKNLEELDISNNRLGAFQICQAITPLVNLRKLIMDENPVETFCDDYYQYIVSKPNNSSYGNFTSTLNVETVTLRHSPLSRLCFTNWLNLTYLDLSDNKINSLQLAGLPVPQKHPLTVDLRGNPMNSLPKYFYYEDTVNRFNGSKNVTILLDWTMECDCEHTLYVKALRKLPQVRLENATCTSGERLIEFKGERFGCDKYPCTNCTCRTSWEDGATVADCDSRRLHALPAVWQFRKNERSKELVVKKILAARNFIETVPEYKYPRSLVEIDLSNNKISRVSESALNALFFDGNRRVNLSGNPLVCDCETQAMLDALSVHRDQVPDYNNLTCSNRESYLHEISHRSLCTKRALLAFGTVTATFLALSAITALLYFRFKLTIKAFLYARGLCLFCVREEELDADKEFDAFVSFASVDDELVADVLLPGLEKDYKICVHTRNWVPGEMIYTQIVKSVEQSKRTIIVLSKNFVESLWGMLEFRTAYVNALREGRVRVICIVVDDVINDMVLDADLKAYLKSNTYLKLRDPWFWQKLKYAMPHPCIQKQSELQNENVVNRENMCREIELVAR